MIDYMRVQFDLLVDGQQVTGERRLEVVDPATGEVFAICSCASPAQLDLAVESAAKAFCSWALTPPQDRQAVVIAMADAMELEIEPLARLLTAEQGKPLSNARTEVSGAIHFLRYVATQSLPVEIIEDSCARRVEVHRRPLGVVAAIVPWNFPVLTAIMKIGAALVTGNTVVLKPAPTTPLTALMMGAMFCKIVPSGVLNVVTDRNDLGKALTSHPSVRRISFTGSTATGTRVIAAAAETLKRVTLELGGNDAGIVLADCDPAEVSKKLFDAAFMNSGQVCVALKRLYVHESLYDAICANLAHYAQAVVVGPGTHEGVELGPVQNIAQYMKIRSLIDEVRDEGATIAGGENLDYSGYFIRPAIVSNILETSRLVKEEQFGPILPIMSFSEIEEVIIRVNNTDFGLGNSIWSTDLTTATKVARHLESGSIWINQHGDVSPEIPFAGAKMSGMGVEMAREGLCEFTQATVINYAKNYIK